MILLQLSRAKDHICSFADLGNHSAFLCLRTLPVECKNLTDKMTNADEDKVFRLLEHLNKPLQNSCTVLPGSEGE